MNKKQISLIICILLVIPVSTVLGTNNEKNDMFLSCGELEVSLQPMPIYLGVKLVISNVGTETLNDVDWTFNTTGGIYVMGGVGSGAVESLDPDESITIKLRPRPLAEISSPIGLGFIVCSVPVRGSSATASKFKTIANAAIIVETLLSLLIFFALADIP